jgi:hypothetical protein
MNTSQLILSLATAVGILLVVSAINKSQTPKEPLIEIAVLASKGCEFSRIHREDTTHLHYFLKCPNPQK